MQRGTKYGECITDEKVLAHPGTTIPNCPMVSVSVDPEFYESDGRTLRAHIKLNLNSTAVPAPASPTTSTTTTTPPPGATPPAASGPTTHLTYLSIHLLLSHEVTPDNTIVSH